MWVSVIDDGAFHVQVFVIEPFILIALVSRVQMIFLMNGNVIVAHGDDTCAGFVRKKAKLMWMYFAALYHVVRW